jgi:hypothetical protein
MSKTMTMSKKREQEQEMLTDAIFDKIEEAGMTIGDVELGKEGGSTGNWGWREDAAVKEEWRSQTGYL